MYSVSIQTVNSRCVGVCKKRKGRVGVGVEERRLIYLWQTYKLSHYIMELCYMLSIVLFCLAQTKRANSHFGNCLGERL